MSIPSALVDAVISFSQGDNDAATEALLSANPLSKVSKIAQGVRKVVSNVTKNAKKVSDPTIKQINPKNLISTQTHNEISGSQVKRLKKDMKKNGFDQTQPVDAVRNFDGRLEIVDGHHRTQAARTLGLDKIPVRVRGE